MEQAEDALDSYRQFRERSNAWLASKRRVGPEDYIDGEAYLDWEIGCSIEGQRHDFRLCLKLVDRVRDPQFGLPVALNVAHPELTGRCHREHELVLVDQVEFVKRNEQVVPSWVWLYVAANLPGSGGSFARFALQNLLEIGVEFGKGEGGIANRLSLGRNGGADRVIQCGAEVVNRVSQDCGDRRGEWPRQRYQHRKSLDFEVKLLDDAVWAAAEKRGDFSLDFSTMRVRPLDL